MAEIIFNNNYNMIECDTTQYNTMQCSRIRYDTTQYVKTVWLYDWLTIIKLKNPTTFFQFEYEVCRFTYLPPPLLSLTHFTIVWQSTLIVYMQHIVHALLHLYLISFFLSIINSLKLCLFLFVRSFVCSFECIIKI